MTIECSQSVHSIVLFTKRPCRYSALRFLRMSLIIGTGVWKSKTFSNGISNFRKGDLTWEENQKIPMRSQVKKEDTWAIEDMYATVEDWEKDFAAAKKVTEEAAEYAGRLGESAGAV